MTNYNITATATSNGLVLANGDTVSVTSGGTANGTEIGNGAEQFVYFSGSASGTEIDSGGIEAVSSGGTTTGTNVAAGGTEYIYSGGTASGLTVADGGYAVLNPNAVASGTTVDNGGTLVVLPGGSATDTTSFAGADIVSTGTVVVGGGQVISLGDTSGAQIMGGDTEYVLNGGHATATNVLYGALEAIYSGGVASGAIIGVAGQDSIYSGGIASDTIVQFVGDEFVFAGGSAQFTTVSGGTQEIQGGFASGTTISNGGVQQVALDGKAVGDIVSSGGVVSVTLGATTGTQLQNGGSEYVVGGATATGTIISSGGTLVVYSGSIVSGTIMLESGSIDLADVTYADGGSADFDAATGTLTVTEGGNQYTEHLSGNYTGEFFHLSQDDSGNTLVTEQGTPCYCRGTRILTDHGEVPVETLRIGDRLITMSGAARPLRWIGTRSYSGRFAAGNKDVLPILFMQSALGTNVPERDLWVSPLHAMFLDGVLIPAWALINGASIVQTARVDSVEYFHLELEAHDVLIAEGALSESFLDDDSRGMFHNAATYRATYPDAAPVTPHYCAPRVEDGDRLQRVRDRIAARLCGLPGSEATG